MANKKAKKAEDIALLELPNRDQRRLEVLRWFRERLIGLSGIPLSVLLGVKADDQEDYEESQE